MLHASHYSEAIYSFTLIGVRQFAVASVRDWRASCRTTLSKTSAFNGRYKQRQMLCESSSETEHVTVAWSHDTGRSRTDTE